MLNFQFDRKKNQSIQETIETYMKIIPKPNLPRCKVIELALENSSQHPAQVHKSTRSLLSKIDNLMKYKMFDNSKAANFFKTLKNSDRASVPNLRLKKIKSKYLSPRVYEYGKSELKKSTIKRNYALSPTILKSPPSKSSLNFASSKSPKVFVAKSPVLPYIPIKKRRNSSIDISKLSINAWDIKTPNYKQQV